MRFIVDQQLPPLLADWLTEQGYSAVHVQDIALDNSRDGLIWLEAMRDNAIVVSRDEDFVKLVRDPGGARLLWVRVGNCDNPTLLETFARNWPFVLTRLDMMDTMIELRR